MTHPDAPVTLDPSAAPLPTRRRFRLERLPQILILALGLLVSLTVAWIAHQWEAEKRATVLHRAVEADAQAIQQTLEGLVADVQAIAQFYNASDAVNADEFARFARPFLERNRAIHALEWVPRVREADRAAFEAQARREGLTEFAIREQVGGELRPADRRPEYFPVYRTESLASSAKALGFDSGSEPLRRAALEQARDTAQPMATAPLTLVEETASRRSLLIYVPQAQMGTLGDTPTERRQRLQGFAVGVIRLNDLMENVLAHFPSQGLDLVLRDVALPGEAGWLAIHPSRTRGPGATLDLAAFVNNPQGDVEQFTVAGHTLELRGVPVPGTDPASGWPLALLGLGLVTSIVLSILYQRGQRAVAQLREREELFRLFMDHSPAIAWIKDAQNRYVYFSKTFEQRFGARLEDWRGKTDFEVWPEDVALAFHASDQAALAANHPLEISETTPNADGGVSHWQVIKIPFLDRIGRRYVGGIGSDVTARRQAEVALQESEALKASEARYRSLFELFSLFMRHSPIYIYIKEVTSTESRTLQASENYEQMLGIPVRDILGKTMAELFPPELAAKISADDWAVIDGGKVLKVDEELNGRHYTSIKFPIVQGERTLLAGYTIDMTERKQMELDLRTSQEYLRAVLDSLHDAVFVHDAKTGQILDVNHRMCELYGCRYEEALQLSIETLSLGIEPFTQDKALAWLRKTREEGPQHFEWHAKTFSGQPFWVDVNSRFVLIGGDERLIVTAHDLTERRRLKAALRDEAIRYRTLFETASDGIFLQDANRCVDCNERGAAMYGLTRQQIIGINPAQLSPERQPDGRLSADVAAQHIQAALQGQPQVFEWQPRRPDGRLLDVEITLNRLQIGDSAYLQAIVRDITERKQADALTQQALLDAKRLAQLRHDFLATMSHEIRTPINGVIGSVDLLARTPLDPQQQDLVETIRDSSAALRELIDDILDFSKIEAGKIALEQAPVSPRGVVEAVCHALQPLAAHQETRLRLFTDPDLPAKILSDGLRLRQILSNLLSNAIKFSSKSMRQGQVAVRAELAGESWLRLTVSDNGIGMTPEVQAMLFNPFVQAETSITRRFGGTGLGLSIVRRLVDLWGGDIAIESAPERGATFRVTLPFTRDHQAACEPSETTLAGLVCLVIAEEELQARDWCRYLEHAGAKAEPFRERSAVIDHLRHGSPERTVLVLEAEQAVAEHWHAELTVAPAPALVIVDQGQRRSPRLLRPGIVLVDDAPLTRDAFVTAVGIAAGRLEPLKNVRHSDVLPATATPPERASVIEQQRLILVAEDNVVNQKVIRQQLALLGLTADLAVNGQEALIAWRQQIYGMLLTDLHMPEMDGYTLALAIRAEENDGHHLPIIALSADVLSETVGRCRAAGMDDYLAKPVVLEQLRATLEKWLPLPVGDATSVPPNTSTDAVTLDERVLAQLIGDDPALISELLLEFRTSVEQDATRMRAAVADADWSTVSTVAYGLKSSSLAIGALPLGDCCYQIEQLSETGSAGAIMDWMKTFEDHLAAVLAVIAKKSPGIALEAVTLDETVLIQMIGDDRALIVELLSDFSNSAEQGQTRMRAAVAVADWETVRAVAHGLKSAAFSIGALPLGDCCKRIEQAVKADDGAAIVEWMKTFEERLTHVLAEIERSLNA